MKTALITTTIHVPHVLQLYRALGPDVRFFVALDQKSADLRPWISELSAKGYADSNTIFFSPDAQTTWKCSAPIGWGCIQRRNIALLEALKWGAEIIVSVDDDNYPIGLYFDYVEFALCNPFNGISMSGLSGWFDPGQLLEPPSRHRGFPLDQLSLGQLGPVIGANIGVAAGMCLGDPDISATTRMEQPREVYSVNELLRVGIVVDPNTRTVFNSQNTSFLRELAPSMFMLPGIGRYDDIFASLICQRVMRERGLHVYFGQPFVWQQRNPHNVLTDLQNEIWGMTVFGRFAQAVQDVVLSKDSSVLEQVRSIYDSQAVLNILPINAVHAALAFLDDCERVMG